VLVLLVHSLAAQKSENQAFNAALSQLTPPVDSHAQTGIPGVDGWFFFAPELQHLKNNDGMTHENPKALEAIIDFKNQLEKAGIRLLVVPVPAKAAIYPDKLALGLQPPTVPPFTADSDFCVQLKTNGVMVLDLAETFHQNRDKGATLYCKTDSHWSPEGIRIAASEIAKNLHELLPNQIFPSVPMSNSSCNLTFRGDLVSADGLTEVVTLNSVSSQGHPVAVSRNSPVVLLGDSHNLVFHSGGDMHAEGAGLPDQLAQALGFPVDLVAVMGSGATAARWSLARRHDNLAGKKAVIWCFTARDLTEGGRWDKVPVIRPPVR
jgi:alginate O-acetyltransferase complex protein AlgJ